MLINRFRDIRISERLLVGLLVGVGLLGSIGMGVLVAMDKIIFAVIPMAIALGIGALVFASQRFDFIIQLLPIIALAIPLALPTGRESKIPIVMALVLLQCGFWIASMYYRGWKVNRSPLNTPFITFCVLMIISFGWSVIYRDPILELWASFPMVQTASLICYLASIGAAFLIGNFMDDEQKLKWFFMIYLIVGGLMVIKSNLGLPLEFLTIRGLWALWFVAPAWAMLIAQPKLAWKWRGLLIIMLLWCFYQVMIKDSGWISGWAPGLVAIAAITFFYSRKVFLMLLPVALIALALNWGFYVKVFEADQEEGSDERIGLWEQNLSIVREHWLFGTGPAGYAAYNMTYFKEDARSTHNNYFDILAQFGVVGFIAWWWLALTGVFEGWYLIRIAPPGLLRTIALATTGGWCAALVSMMLGDWVLPFAYNQTIGGYQYTVTSWFFLGTLIAIRTILDRQGLIPQPVAEEEDPFNETSYA
ncbi:MAG: O-antigen ligase family protein [Roseiflexaceae bacterium]